MLIDIGSKKRLNAATILLGSTMTTMAGTIIAPALPQLSVVFQSIPNVDFLVKLLLTLHALFIAISAPVMGFLLDRWGRKPVLIFSLILYGISGSAGFFFNSLFYILVSRAFLGVAIAGILIGFTTLIGDYFKGRKLDQFMGLQAAFISFGAVIFLVGGGVLADIGWRFPFLVYLSSFIILPGVLFFVDEPEKITNISDNSRYQPPIKSLIFIYLTAFIGMVLFYMVPVLLPFYLDSLDVSSTQIGMAIASATLSAAFISTQYKRIRDYLSFEKIFSVLFLFMGIGYSIVAAANSYNYIVAGASITGLGLGLIIPNVNAWVTSFVSQEVRGRAVGGLTAFFLIGQFFSPIISQPIITHTGIGGLFAVSGVAGFFLSGLFILLKRS